MSKLVNVIAIGAALSATGYALYGAQLERQQRSQLADYSAQLEQVLAQVEDNTRRRLDYEKQIADLRSQLLLANNKVQNLDAELNQTKELIDPDYQQMEQQMRQRISAEFQRQAAREQNSPSAASLITELSNVSMDERMAIMAVQGQYSEFLNSLNVNTQRKEVIAQALVNMTMELNSKRMDLATQQLEPRELRQQMVALSSPQAVRESLAYELTEEELAQFETYQHTQPNITIGALGAGPGTGNVFMMRSERGGDGRPRRGQGNVTDSDAPVSFDVLPGGGGVILQQRIQPAPTPN